MNIIKSYAKTLLASLVAIYTASGTNLTNVTLDDAKTWLTAAVASTLPVIITALDPTDPRWGIVRQPKQLEIPLEPTE